MQPKEIFPTTTELRKNREYWNPKILHFRGRKIVYDQNIRTGYCYFCKKYGRTQNYYKRTYLHHLDYDDSDPIKWTLELCSGCHYRCDPKNRMQVSRSYWKKDDARWFVEKEMKRLGLKRY